MVTCPKCRVEYREGEGHPSCERDTLLSTGLGTEDIPQPAPKEEALRAGYEVGEYVIAAAIGRGAFGTVYRAEHPVIGKRVAIKVLQHKFSLDRQMVSRFNAEA